MDLPGSSARAINPRFNATRLIQTPPIVPIERHVYLYRRLAALRHASASLRILRAITSCP